MSNYTYLPELSDITVFSTDKSYFFRGHKFALVKIDKWKDKVIKEKEFVTPFNKEQLLVVLPFLYEDKINNGRISEIDTLHLIYEIIDIKFFSKLVNSLWFDLFDCMKGAVETKIFEQIVINIDVYSSLFSSGDFLGNILKLSKETLKCIPSSFMSALIIYYSKKETDKTFIILLGSIISKWGCSNGDNESTTGILMIATKKIPNIFDDVPTSVFDECVNIFSVGPILTRIIEIKKKEVEDKYKKPSYELAKDVVDNLYSHNHDNWRFLIRYMCDRERAYNSDF